MNNIIKNGIWVIGDVHGEYNKLIDLISTLPKKASICFVGDLVDRGEESFKVVEYIIKNNYHCVLGNHELMMIKAIDCENTNYMWQCSGGDKTIQSYKSVSDETWYNHIEYLKKLPYFKYYKIEGYKPLVVSHSYLHHLWQDKNHIYDEKSAKDILWRHMYDEKLFKVDKEIKNNVFNIFGHSIVKKPLITKTFAMIDTGAAFDNKIGSSKLSAIHYPSLDIVSV